MKQSTMILEPDVFLSDDEIEEQQCYLFAGWITRQIEVINNTMDDYNNEILGV